MNPKRKGILKFYIVRTLVETPKSLGQIYGTLQKTKLESGKRLLLPSETFNVVKQMIVELMREKQVEARRDGIVIRDGQGKKRSRYLYCLIGDLHGS